MKYEALTFRVHPEYLNVLPIGRVNVFDWFWFCLHTFLLMTTFLTRETFMRRWSFMTFPSSLNGLMWLSEAYYNMANSDAWYVVSIDGQGRATFVAFEFESVKGVVGTYPLDWEYVMCHVGLVRSAGLEEAVVPDFSNLPITDTDYLLFLSYCKSSSHYLIYSWAHVK